jgi:hypothetical protein
MTTLEDTLNNYEYIRNTKDDEFYYDYDTIGYFSGNNIDDNIIYKKTIKENLKFKHYIKIGEECSICYECIYHKKNAYLTTCGHSFHRTCISKWLIATYEAGDCPICRQDIGYYEGNIYNSKNSLDKIEDLWLNYDKILPELCCEYIRKNNHIKGFNKNCDKCLKYRNK